MQNQPPSPTSPSFFRRRRTSPLQRRVWKIAIPSISENLLQTSLIMIDTLMIARFGAVALAASSFAGVLIWRSQMTFGCIDKGTMALVARAAGAGDKDEASRAVAQSIMLSFIIGTLLALGIFIGAPHFLTWMKAEPEVVAMGTPYLTIVGLASIPRLFFAVVATSLRATGDTKTPMWISLGMNIISILLNFPLIYGIPAIPMLGITGWDGLGLTGSGISTAIAITFAAVAVGWVAQSGRSQYKLKWEHFRADFTTLNRLVRVSIPAFIEEIIISFGFIPFYTFIATFGTVAVASHAIAARVESLSYMVGIGFAVAAAALVGQSLGQRDPDQARQAFRIATKSSVVLMSFAAVGLVLLAPYIVRLFKPESIEIQEMATILVMIAAIEQPVLGIAMTLGGGLRGSGDTFTPMISSLICSVGVRVGASYFFAFTLDLGIYGIYFGTMADWTMRALFLYIFYRSERWARIRV